MTVLLVFLLSTEYCTLEKPSLWLRFSLWAFKIWIIVFHNVKFDCFSFLILVSICFFYILVYISFSQLHRGRWLRFLSRLGSIRLRLCGWQVFDVSVIHLMVYLIRVSWIRLVWNYSWRFDLHQTSCFGFSDLYLAFLLSLTLVLFSPTLVINRNCIRTPVNSKWSLNISTVWAL